MGNGPQYNIVLNGRQFLIQENWVNAGFGYCSMTRRSLTVTNTDDAGSGSLRQALADVMATRSISIRRLMGRQSH